MKNIQSNRVGKSALMSHHFIYKNLEIFNRKKIQYKNGYNHKVKVTPIKNMLDKSEKLKLIPRKL